MFVTHDATQVFPMAWLIYKYAISVAFVKDNATSSIWYFENHVFCAKRKEVDPIKLNFSVTNKCFDRTQIYD